MTFYQLNFGQICGLERSAGGADMRAAVQSAPVVKTWAPVGHVVESVEVR